MPAALDSCVQQVMAKDPSLDESNAYAICNAQLSGGGQINPNFKLGDNLTGTTLDANGDLYLKYFFADASYTERVPVNGRFSIDKAALAAKDHEAIGLPFSILPRQDLSINGDWHPWSPKPRATWEEHVEFAKSYSPGHIVAVTPNTQLQGSSIDSIRQNNGRFAIIKITDKRARDAFVSNPSLIPRQVSPGFLNKEVPNRDNIRDFRWVHLAAVPRGAYGDKATVYASCLGPEGCINHLVGASVADLYQETKDRYCPIGAAESLTAFSFSSHGNLDAFSQNRMSDNANTVPPTPAAGVAVSNPAPAANRTEPKGAPISRTQPGTSRPIVKLKANNAAVTQQGNAAQGAPTDKEDDITKLKSEVEEMRKYQQLAQRREEIKKIIPKELFIHKGKFDEKAFEAEVDKRLQSGASDEQLNEFYALWMDKQKLINAGFQVQGQPAEQQAPAAQAPETMAQVPMGGSAEYKTPSEVPAETVGGSQDPRLRAVNDLLRWTRRSV